ncbi:NlpC/P60 family protein [Blautia glucerasea]|uniref:NlpC/P60 family protein n=1 Tax=Blautia glucerasea TaxID=536633 RepID=UPI003A7F4F57
MDPEWGAVEQVTAEGSQSTGSLRAYGLDCSGFVTWAVINGYQDQAMIAAVGSGTSDQWERANVVSEADAQPGDLVFQRGPEAGSSNHVGIICGKTDAGDWIVVHCSSGKNGVTVGEAYSASFRYIRQPSFYPNADQVAQMRGSGEAITTAQFITGIDVANNLQDLINANLSTSGDMDTVTIDPSGNGTVSPGSLYVANSLQELFEAGQHVSVFSQVSYGDAAEVGSQDGGIAGSAKAAQTAETDFSGIMVTNSLQELLSATIGIQ